MSTGQKLLMLIVPDVVYAKFIVTLNGTIDTV